MGEMRKIHSILFGKPAGKRPLERHRHRCEDNTKTDLWEIVWEGVDWVHLDQGRDQWWDLVNTVMNLRVS
jgi:hypothetical protein